MRAAQAGDGIAYEHLLKRVAARARSYFLRRIQDTDAAEDFAQEVLLAVHGARHTYDPERPLLPWLAAILRYRLADAVRSYLRHSGRADRTQSVEEILGRPAAPDFTLHQLALESALSTLPAKQRAVVQLTRLEGRSSKEAAEILGITSGALRALLFRARQSLLRILLEQGYEDR